MLAALRKFLATTRSPQKIVWRAVRRSACLQRDGDQWRLQCAFARALWTPLRVSVLQVCCAGLLQPCCVLSEDGMYMLTRISPASGPQRRSHCSATPAHAGHVDILDLLEDPCRIAVAPRKHACSTQERFKWRHEFVSSWSSFFTIEEQPSGRPPRQPCRLTSHLLRFRSRFEDVCMRHDGAGHLHSGNSAAAARWLQRDGTRCTPSPTTCNRLPRLNTDAP